MFFQYTLIILLQFILDFRCDTTEEFFEETLCSTAMLLCLLTKEGNNSFWNPTKDSTGHWTPLQHSDGISTKIRPNLGCFFIYLLSCAVLTGLTVLGQRLTNASADFCQLMLLANITIYCVFAVKHFKNRKCWLYSHDICLSLVIHHMFF